MGRLRSLDADPMVAWPLPDVTASDFAGYWDACAQERLVVQGCLTCDRLAWPPRPACPQCGGFERRWVAVAGAGGLYSWTVVHRAMHAAFTALVPYAVGVVALDDAPVRMLGRIVAADVERLAVGQSMRVEFEPHDGVRLPVWRPDDRQGTSLTGLDGCA